MSETKEQRVKDLERRLQDIRETKDKSTPEFRQKQADASRDLNASIDRGDHDTKTPHNGAVFYDNGGSREVPEGASAQPTRYQQSNRERALDYCKQPGNEHCRAVDHTSGGQWMARQKLYEALPKEDADRAWSKLSGQYARNASGETHAFVRTQSAEHRVFLSTERPELQHNQNVTGITYHHNDHGYEMTHRQHLSRAGVEQAAPPPRPQTSGPSAGPPSRTASPEAPSASAAAPSKGRSR